MQSNLCNQLSHVFWLGGSPCAGKSTIAERLGERWGMEVYHIDEAFERHTERFDAVAHPTVTKWTSTPWNDLWMQPPDVLLAEAIAAYTEHFALVLEELLARPLRQATDDQGSFVAAQDEPLLVEGNPLMPHLIADLIAGPNQALWLVASPDFLRMTYPNRGEWVQGIVEQCDDPDQALANWMNRDAAFAEWVGEQAQRLGLRMEMVDGTRSLAEMEQVVGEWFGVKENLLGL